MAHLGWGISRLWRHRRLWVGLAATGSAAAVAFLRWKASRHGREYPAGARPLQDGRDIALWRFDNDCLKIRAGKRLRIEVSAPAVIHWSTDKWHTVHDVATVYSGSGIHRADLATEKLSAHDTVLFTFFWPDVNRWEGEDFMVHIE